MKISFHRRVFEEVSSYDTLMYRLIYVSSARRPFADQELEELLQKSRQNNIASKITGLLLYRDGMFMQILEGSEQSVLTLLAKIKSDSRHHSLKVVIGGQAPRREFSDWSMAFKKLDAETSREVPGYYEFEQLSLISNKFLRHPSKTLGLLLAFKRDVP